MFSEQETISKGSHQPHWRTSFIHRPSEAVCPVAEASRNAGSASELGGGSAATQSQAHSGALELEPIHPKTKHACAWSWLPLRLGNEPTSQPTNQRNGAMKRVKRVLAGGQGQDSQTDRVSGSVVESGLVHCHFNVHVWRFPLPADPSYPGHPTAPLSFLDTICSRSQPPYENVCIVCVLFFATCYFY